MQFILFELILIDSAAVYLLKRVEYSALLLSVLNPPSISNPQSAMSVSPLSNMSRMPHFLVSSLSEIHPGYRSDTNTTAPLGEMPINPLYVLVFLYVEKVNYCSSGSAGCSTKTSVASIMTLVKGYLSLKHCGMLSSIKSRGIHNGICLNCK